MKGKLGLAVGLAAGYVLGTRAGRERYQQLAASARRLADDPSMQRLQTELGNLFGDARQEPTATGERAAGKPAGQGQGTGAAGKAAATPAPAQPDDATPAKVTRASRAGGSGSRAGGKATST